jgi:hypothetical protein
VDVQKDEEEDPARSLPKASCANILSFKKSNQQVFYYLIYPKWGCSAD